MPKPKPSVSCGWPVRCCATADEAPQTNRAEIPTSSSFIIGGILQNGAGKRQLGPGQPRDPTSQAQPRHPLPPTVGAPLEPDAPAIPVSRRSQRAAGSLLATGKPRVGGRSSPPFSRDCPSRLRISRDCSWVPQPKQSWSGCSHFQHRFPRSRHEPHFPPVCHQPVGGIVPARPGPRRHARHRQAGAGDHARRHRPGRPRGRAGDHRRAHAQAAHADPHRPGRPRPPVWHLGRRRRLQGLVP